MVIVAEHITRGISFRRESCSLKVQYREISPGFSVPWPDFLFRLGSVCNMCLSSACFGS